MNAASSHRECDSNYRGVAINIDPNWRVIACRDGIQWILQQKRGEKRGQPRFEARGYFRTRKALIRLCRNLIPTISHDALAALEGLPERI
ncbi:MAG: hypothetical protein C0606_11180 [Hyphomicrobiales bacterium]|nr:MAG: hypothetical protein C0606_11180 [Hyphomicrobiales bacterium]